jgi:hypothetical protein
MLSIPRPYRPSGGIEIGGQMQLSMASLGMGYFSYKRDARRVASRLRMLEEYGSASPFARRIPEVGEYHGSDVGGRRRPDAACGARTRLDR